MWWSLAGAGLYADRVETAELALKKKQDHGKKGGEVTGSALAPARDELKRLLETNCPSEGWKTKTAAIDSVVGQLTDFVETHKIKLKTDNLYNAILTWCKRYPALKDVLESSLHKNRKISAYIRFVPLDNLYGICHKDIRI